MAITPTTSPSRAPAHFLVRDGLVQVRIEVGAERLDGRDAALLQKFRELALDQFEAGLERLRLRRRRRGERAIEVVDDRQQVAEHVGRRPFDHVLAIALDALAEVVELGGLAEQAIVQIVAFLLQRVRPRPRPAGSSGASAAHVLWIDWLLAHDFTDFLLTSSAVSP